MKTIQIALLAVTLLTFSDCGSKDNTAKDEVQTVKPPGVSLHIAALQGNITAVKQHIAAGTNLNTKDAYGSTPLIISATFGKTDIATALIEAGADLTITNNEGATPLHVAALFCRTEIVKALLDKGADKSATNNHGATALQSVTVPFEVIKPAYDSIGKALKPFGLNLDYERIKNTRPKIAEMLK